MSNKRKLQTKNFVRPINISEFDHADEFAYTGEVCAFHPDCCDPDDFDCKGCGQPAVHAVVFRIEGTERRSPFCEDHAAGMGIAFEAVARRQVAESNLRATER